MEKFDVNKETLKAFLERLEREEKVICNLERIVGEDPVTKEPIDMVIIKTCPKKETL
jgi:phosphopantetheine adenylyltransferase